MIKTTGLEFKKYYADNTIWPEGSYHDEGTIKINNVETQEIDDKNIKDSDQITIIGSYVYLPDKDMPISMEKHFKNWQKTQSLATIVFQISKEKVEEISTLIKKNGGTVIQK